MPTKKRKGRARQPFRNGVGVRPPVSPQPGVKEVGDAAKTIPAPVNIPDARSRRTAVAEPSKAMLFQHAQVSRELKRIVLITGSIFIILILLSFILPRIT
ncbi:MAG: hypothetical protein HW414_1154 [Dehalococcoidia bacterium]|nr:hypothetical protein [Dehalococcoidia bacterium]